MSERVQFVTVFLVEAGDYEQRCVHHVADSIHAAVEAIHRSHAKYDSRIVPVSGPTLVVYPNQPEDAQREWRYVVNVVHQCGHDLVRPIESVYDIIEWAVESATTVDAVDPQATSQHRQSTRDNSSDLSDQQAQPRSET